MDFKEPPAERRGTFRFNLPGGVGRLRAAILYVAERSKGAERFGVIKLNKIIWRTDFEAFACRGIPVTGREYKRLELGPAPREMPHLLRDMRMKGEVTTERIELGNGLEEHRTRALITPDVALFSPDDLSYLDRSIQYYWNKTGVDASDDSHGAAWLSRNNGDLMPYELAHLSDRPLSNHQFLKLRSFVEDEGLFSE